MRLRRDARVISATRQPRVSAEIEHYVESTEAFRVNMAWEIRYIVEASVVHEWLYIYMREPSQWVKGSSESEAVHIERSERAR
jgi:hypothetical protein